MSKIIRTISISIIGIAVVAAITFGVIRYLKANAPVAEKKAAEMKIPVVEAVTVFRGDIALPLTSEGVISARRETILSAQVAGRITHVHPDFEVGGSFKNGEIIAQLDRLNYEAAVAQAKSSLADAKLALEQEEARGEQAARDWKKIGNGDRASEMVLRIPFLKSAKARVVSAQAMLEKAVEDLDRTQIRAPFDCRVRETNLDLGAMVGIGARLGVVYDPQQYLVRLPLSLADYSELPEDAQISLTTEIAGKTHQWNAEIMWSEGDIDRTTLSAYVVARVLPSGLQPSRFRFPPAGLFVTAKFSGAMLSKVIAIPRSAVRGRDQIAVINDEDKLEFRTLKIARTSSESVYATEGLDDGERVILTKMELPVAGMQLALAEKKP